MNYVVLEPEETGIFSGDTYLVSGTLGCCIGIYGYNSRSHTVHAGHFVSAVMNVEEIIYKSLVDARKQDVNFYLAGAGVERWMERELQQVIYSDRVLCTQLMDKYGVSTKNMHIRWNPINTTSLMGLDISSGVARLRIDTLSGSNIYTGPFDDCPEFIPWK